MIQIFSLKDTTFDTIANRAAFEAESGLTYQEESQVELENEWNDIFTKILAEYDANPNVAEGMKWIAAYIAHQKRHLNANLGHPINDPNLEIPSAQFNEFVKAGYMTYPTPQFHRTEQ